MNILISQIKQFKRFLKQIFIKVWIDSEQQMARVLFWTPKPPRNALKPLTITILIQIFHNHVSVIPWKLILVQIRAFPRFFSNNALCQVV